MAKQKAALALLVGAGFSAILLLLLNVSASAALSSLLSLFLLPGGILADLILRSKEFGPPLFVLGANAVVYSVIAYVGVSTFGRGIAPEKIRLAAIRLTLPVAVVVCLACIPRFNPLWPRGMTELTMQEKALQEALPIGMGIDAARAVLHSKGIRFYEEKTETSQLLWSKLQEQNIAAAAGDRVISARVETEAGQFPCGYAIEVILLFGPNDKDKKSVRSSITPLPIRTAGLCRDVLSALTCAEIFLGTDIPLEYALRANSPSGGARRSWSFPLPAQIPGRLLLQPVLL